MYKILSSICIVILLSGALFSQTTTPTPEQKKPDETRLTKLGATDVSSAVSTLRNGAFESAEGRFSIGISDPPTKMIDKASQNAKAKGIDVGKQYVWIFQRGLFTAFYKPSFNDDGNPMPQVYADVEIGTRKGVLNQNATITSEKPIKYGEHRGTEFRYTSKEGVRYINRTYLIGDVGYQIVGGYLDEKDESVVVGLLDSFRLLKDKVR